MNYKIKITEENQAIVKRIANENGMNIHGFHFNVDYISYEIMEGKFVYIGTILNSEFRILTTEKFIEMFDKQQSEWKPKRGERVLVWDMDESDATERIFLAEIEGAIVPIIVVSSGNEFEFLNNQTFHIIGYRNMKQLPIQEAKVEIDFKTKVVELIEAKIEILNEEIDDCYEGKESYTALNHEICKGELEDILDQIKEL